MAASRLEATAASGAAEVVSGTVSEAPAFGADGVGSGITSGCTGFEDRKGQREDGHRERDRLAEGVAPSTPTMGIEHFAPKAAVVVACGLSFPSAVLDRG